MKLQHFVLAGLLSLIFASCRDSGAIPSLALRAFVVEFADGRPDTIFLNIHPEHRAFMIQRGDNPFTATFDTVSIGQVVHFETKLWSQYTPIKEYRIWSNRETAPRFTWSSWHDAEIRSVFNESESELSPHHANLVTRNVHHEFSFNFLFEAFEADNDLMLVFMVSNNDGQEFNPGGMTIRIPIRP